MSAPNSPNMARSRVRPRGEHRGRENTVAEYSAHRSVRVLRSRLAISWGRGAVTVDKGEGPPVCRPAVSDESRPGSEEHSESENGDEQRVALPSWNRSRSKRKANVKAEESEDAFQRGVRQASKRAATHPWVAMAGVFVVAGVVAGASFLLKNQDSAKAEVTAKLADAVAAEYRGKVVTKDVIDRFGPKRVTPNPFFEENEARDRAVEEALAELEGDSEKTIVIMGELARGNRALREGNFEEASARFNAFLAGTDPQHPAVLPRQRGSGLRARKGAVISRVPWRHSERSGRKKESSTATSALFQSRASAGGAGA